MNIYNVRDFTVLKLEDGAILLMGKYIRDFFKGREHTSHVLLNNVFEPTMIAYHPVRYNAEQWRASKNMLYISNPKGLIRKIKRVVL
jgi:hypothetical protein